MNDKRVDEDGNRLRYTSRLLPPYLRKTKSIEELIPWLYLRGISTGDFSQALAALLGPEGQTGQGQEYATRHLDGRDTSGCAPGV